jgi:hypothetical protein
MVGNHYKFQIEDQFLMGIFEVIHSQATVNATAQVLDGLFSAMESKLSTKVTVPTGTVELTRSLF